jgi:uncharacterized protein
MTTRDELESPPGAEPYPSELRERLWAAYEAKGPDYVPRTQILGPDGRPRFLNRLILEGSPYLLQHAHNPVDWYSWGPEAFSAARAQNRPIFLSIGYSTCHWCHVMEHESFDHIEIARLMNERYVCIKVDREQRPDVDEIYMSAVLMTTGHGGWPMSSFLTPEGKPFFGATYFPPQRFAGLLVRIEELWRTQRERLESDAEKVASAVAQSTAARGRAEQVGAGAIDKAVQQSLLQHDDRHGGFGSAPKFPHEPELLLLLQLALRTGHEEARDAAVHSLFAMARGGIHDQIAGGFARYSTDERWLVPHFEKMLYNQAHLGRAFLHAYRLTGHWYAARVARETLEYVLRDLCSPEGAFYSATDADSEGEEGLFFLWTPAELRAALPEAEAELALDLFQATEHGNFEGKNILHLPVPLDVYARKRQLALPELLSRLDRIRERLYAVRERREHPLRDEKILTAWNGMMITTLAEAAAILSEPRYLEAARRAAELLWARSRRAPGDLWRVHLAGSSSIPAQQEDYATLAEALLALYDATDEPGWLERARELADAMLGRFWDTEQGGFFMSAEDADPHLIARPKSPNDGATPSGNSVAARVLVRLAARTGEPLYARRAAETLAAFGAAVERYPAGYSYLLAAADELLHGEAGALRHAAGGAVRVLGRLEPTGEGQGRLLVELRLRSGWHVNAHEPLGPELVPTTLELAEGPWQLESLSYPEPRLVRLGFQAEPLAVYEESVAIEAAVRWPPGELGDAPRVPVRLRLQACDESACQRPESVLLQVPAAASLGPGAPETL